MHKLLIGTLSTYFHSLTSMEDLCQARTGSRGGRIRRIFNCLGRCGISPFSSSHRWFTAQDGATLPFTLAYSPFFIAIEETFSSFPGMDQACRKILSHLNCKRGHEASLFRIHFCDIYIQSHFSIGVHFFKTLRTFLFADMQLSTTVNLTSKMH